jgi:hypothetical protein
MRCKYLMLAAVALGAFGANRASAEILSLDCSDSAGVYDKIWVDLDKSTITQNLVRIAPSDPPATYPAQITATEIKWTTQSTGAPAWFKVSIDRTTGLLTQVGAGIGSGYSTRQCAKGSTPFPDTKF